MVIWRGNGEDNIIPFQANVLNEEAIYDRCCPTGIQWANPKGRVKLQAGKSDCVFIISHSHKVSPSKSLISFYIGKFCYFFLM